MGVTAFNIPAEIVSAYASRAKRVADRRLATSLQIPPLRVVPKRRLPRGWIPGEDAILREWAGRISLADLARHLDRHHVSVCEHAKELGLSTRWRRHGFIRRDTVLASQHPTIHDLYWAAGFLEGEGTFVRPERVAARQKNPESLHRLSRFFGGKVTFVRQGEKPLANFPNAAIWNWQISGSQARGVMMTLFSLMPAWRKSQIKRALAEN